MSDKIEDAWTAGFHTGYSLGRRHGEGNGDDDECEVVAEEGAESYAATLARRMQWTSEFPTDTETGWRWCYVDGRVRPAMVYAAHGYIWAHCDGRTIHPNDPVLWGDWIAQQEPPKETDDAT